MIEEYVGVVRAVLAGSAGGFAGQVFRTGMVPLDSPVVRPDLPIYLGALGPRMLALAGRIADGVIVNLMSPAQAGDAAAIVRAAAKAVGRDPSSLPVACVVHLCLSDDRAAAAAAARSVAPRYACTPLYHRSSGPASGWTRRGRGYSPGTEPEPRTWSRRRSPTASWPVPTPRLARRGSPNTGPRALDNFAPSPSSRTQWAARTASAAPSRPWRPATSTRCGRSAAMRSSIRAAREALSPS